MSMRDTNCLPGQNELVIITLQNITNHFKYAFRYEIPKVSKHVKKLEFLHNKMLKLKLRKHT